MDKIVKAKNGSAHTLRRLHQSDHNNIVQYLQHLSVATKQKFGPHHFDMASIELFYADAANMGYLSIHNATSYISGYAIVKAGFLAHDAARLQSYGLALNNETDCSLAPSVADYWQGKGIGSLLFEHILYNLKKTGFQRIILWGGVQAANEKAVALYKKYGFKSPGTFEYNGLNIDMVLEINPA